MVITLTTANQDDRWRPNSSARLLPHLGQWYATQRCRQREQSTACWQPQLFLEWYNGNPGQLAEYKFHVDFATPANSTYTGPFFISVADFDPNAPQSFLSRVPLLALITSPTGSCSALPIATSAITSCSS